MKSQTGMGADPGISIGLEIDSDGWPDEVALRETVRQAIAATWAELDLPDPAASEVSFLFTDDDHMRKLNAAWRGIDKPTNVLSFPAAFAGIGQLAPMLGDIVLAAGTVMREATLENRLFAHHISHLIVHGLLHLLGYDHQTDEEADGMEKLEIAILSHLGIPDPYDRSLIDQV